MGRRTLLGYIRLCALCVLVVLFVGCGSSADKSTTVNLRIMQTSPNAPTSDVLVDGAKIAGNLGFGNATSYISVKVGSRHIQITPASGSAIFDQSVSVTSDAHQTLLLTGSSSGIQSTRLTDSGTTSTTGDGHVRVFNAASGIAAADVYIVPAGSTILGVAPVTGSAPLAFNKDTGYQLAAIGSYEVLLTAPGTVNVFLDTGPIAITQGQNQTVVVLDGNASGFTYSALTDQ
jgi:hypothetical protein